jgi:hypothetical protein
MKPSAIKTRCIYADIHGLAQRSPVSTQLSIHRRRVRELQTCAVTVERSFQTLQIGTLAQNISTMFINLANATRPKNSFVLITSGNT